MRTLPASVGSPGETTLIPRSAGLTFYGGFPGRKKNFTCGIRRLLIGRFWYMKSGSKDAKYLVSTGKDYTINLIAWPDPITPCNAYTPKARPAVPRTGTATLNTAGHQESKSLFKFLYIGIDLIVKAHIFPEYFCT